MHVPVLLNECLDALAVRADGTYLDATAGLGGHTRAIASKLTTGIVIAVDRDAESLNLARQNVGDLADRVRFVQAKHSVLIDALARLGVEQVDGLLADLGVSRYQLTDPERGFSFMAEGPIDMRMDRSEGYPAADIVNYWSEKDLADLIFQLGEERRSRRIARAIVRARPVRDTAHLSRIIAGAVPRIGRIHQATQTFQALRMATNAEQAELKALLGAIPRLVRSGGRVAMITFMSLEDRLVKQSFQALAREGMAVILTKHVVRPSEEEVYSNPASRSAKLRTLEMN